MEKNENFKETEISNDNNVGSISVLFFKQQPICCFPNRVEADNVKSCLNRKLAKDVRSQDFKIVDLYLFNKPTLFDVNIFNLLRTQNTNTELFKEAFGVNHDHILHKILNEMILLNKSTVCKTVEVDDDPYADDDDDDDDDDSPEYKYPSSRKKLPPNYR